MKENPEVSVIMTTYNGRRTLGKAILSILRQTMRNFELIAVDRGSSDDSLGVCEAYARLDARVRVLRSGRSDAGSARNAGLDAARGRYVVFAGDSDIAGKTMLAFLVNLAGKTRADIAFCGAGREADGVHAPDVVFKKPRVFTPLEAAAELLEGRPLDEALPAKLWRRNLFQDIRFPEGDKGGLTTVYKLFAKARVIAGQGVPLYCFTRPEAGRSSAQADGRVLTRDELEEYRGARGAREYVLAGGTSET